MSSDLHSFPLTGLDEQLRPLYTYACTITIIFYHLLLVQVIEVMLVF